MNAEAPTSPALAPLLLRTEDAAALLSMSRSGFDQFEAAGLIGPKPARFGRSIRWSRDELTRWAAAGCPPRCEWIREGAAR